MTVKTGLNRWSPDTCGCRLIHRWTWDDALPIDTLTDVFESVEYVCDLHTAIGMLPTESLWDWVLDENRRKNITFNLAKLERADLTLENFIWSYDSARQVLIITLIGITLTTQQRNRIQNACDNQFGSGKVIIA